VGLLVMALQWTDSIDRVSQVYFYDGQRQNMVLGFSEPQASRAVNDVARLPGVLAAEPMRLVGADFSVGTRRHRGSITGLPRDTRLQPIHDDASNEDLPVPAGGLMLATHLAAKLGVEPGDRVWVDVLEERRPAGFLPVAGVFETTIAMPAYMDLDALNRLLLVRPSVEYVNLLVDRAAEPELFARLKELPAISAIMLKRAAIESFHETIAEHLLIYIGIFSLFAGLLGFGVAYNSARIALSERGRELATLRVLGFTRAEISYILLGELALLVLIALPLGCLIGRALTILIGRLLDTELFRLPLVIEPSTYGLATVFAIAATALSAFLVRQRIDRLDLIGVLKTRE
jgi:putative ABC transport system permease protein